MADVAHMEFKPDVLGGDFEQLTITQPADYEGEVVCTLIRKRGPAKSSRAVLYVHGYNDYFFQREMAGYFDRQGFTFYALDLRKYGRSYREHQHFNHVRDLQEYYPDIRDALQVIRHEGHTQLLLSGHSNGGLTLSLFAHDHAGQGLFDGLFLNSPFFEMPLPPIIKKLAVPLLLWHAVKYPEKMLKMGFNEIYGHSLHIAERGEWSYNTDWKPHRSPGLSYGWFRAVRLGQARVAKGLRIDCPVLVMHSTNSIRPKQWTEKAFEADVILNHQQISNCALRIKGDVTIRAIPEGMHDLLLSRPTVRQKAYSTLTEWIEKKL